jgi:hypothetical protein
MKRANWISMLILTGLAEWPRWLLEGKPSPSGRYTFSTWLLWTKDSPLSESGLLGPVRLIMSEPISIPF